MSEVANFIARWGRLKRLAELKRSSEAASREDATLPSTAATVTANQDRDAEKPAPIAPEFDLARLPPLDSITASTDIRAFLESGVPTEMTRSALRRAWVSDPLIRNFIGIAENQWDFTNPAAIPGFGPLQDTGDVPGLIAQAIARLDKSLDRSAGCALDNNVTEKLPTAADESQRAAIDEKTGQAALATQRDREAADLASDNNQLETGSQHSQSREGTSPRRGRHAHGSAMPR